MSRPRTVRWSTAIVAASLLILPTGAWPASASSAGSAAPGQLYLVHGVPGSAADLLLDGAVVADGASPSTVVGPLEVPPGGHDVVFRPDGGTAVTAVVDVSAGATLHVVAHRAADATAPARITPFSDDVSAVGPGRARLAVAHTAVVSPADVRVDGAVLFENIANGEVLTLEVPASTYQVDIVPTGAPSPVVFGPTDLTVEAGTLLRVFAVGDPADGGMEAVVHAVSLEVLGAPVPAMAAMGDGGQVAAARAGDRGWAAVVGVSLVALLALLALLARRGRAG